MFTHEADLVLAQCVQAMGEDTGQALESAFEGYDRWVQTLKAENAELRERLERIEQRIAWIFA